MTTTTELFNLAQLAVQSEALRFPQDPQPGTNMQTIARIPHYGFETPQPATKQPTVTNQAEVVRLPYMGPSVHDDTVGEPYPTEEIRFKRYAVREELAQAAKTEEFDDPYDILVRKVSHMARLLGCTEREAENILFDRLG